MKPIVCNVGGEGYDMGICIYQVPHGSELWLVTGRGEEQKWASAVVCRSITDQGVTVLTNPESAESLASLQDMHFCADRIRDYLVPILQNEAGLARRRMEVALTALGAVAKKPM